MRKREVRMLRVEMIDTIDLSVDRKLGRNRLPLDEFVYRFSSFGVAVKLRDQPTCQRVGHALVSSPHAGS
jgi:hypothetical protein